MPLYRLTIMLFIILSSRNCFAENDNLRNNVDDSPTINIAVASNFTAPMKELIRVFEDQSSGKITASYSSSGKAFAQIIYGAPFSLLFSADQEKPLQLIKQGKAIESSRVTYALGSIALWSNKATSAQQLKDKLLTQQYHTLALANPKLAPYGKAAQEVLNHFDINQTSRNRWVKGENIAQTYQFVLTENAEIGFIALSQIMPATDETLQTESGTESTLTDSYWLIPDDIYSPIKQDAVLLSHGKNSSLAQDFLHFIQSNQAKAIIKRYGYKTTPTKTDD